MAIVIVLVNELNTAVTYNYNSMRYETVHSIAASVRSFRCSPRGRTNGQDKRMLYPNSGKNLIYSKSYKTARL